MRIKTVIYGLILGCCLLFVSSGVVSAETHQPYTCDDVSDISRSNCNALQALHDAGFGRTWFQKPDACNWSGVLGCLPPKTCLKVPAERCRDQPIQALHLFNAAVTKIPDEISALENLQSLTLGNVTMSDSSGLLAIGNLKTLFWLKLNNVTSNGSKNSLDLGNPNALIALSIERNSFTHLSGSLGNLTRLQSLVVRGNHNLTAIPASIGKISSLKILLIDDNNGLLSVPASISNLNSLDELIISRNTSLKSVPDELRRESFPAARKYWIDVPFDAQLTDAGGDSGTCIIPPSGPWPPCATNGHSTPIVTDSGDGTGGGVGCEIPPSGPWPPCATGDVNCKIPPSGPWPPCATDGDSTPIVTDSGDGIGGSPDCEIPPSGPWPPCAMEGDSPPIVTDSGDGTGGGVGCDIPPSGPWPPCARHK